MPFTVAIVGRPNVGKSTLFNRLIGRRLALVDDQPGVTRDRREGDAQLGDLAFKVIDTAGLENAERDSLSARMQGHTAAAIAKADAILFLIDARAGATASDRAFADMVRKSGKSANVRDLESRLTRARLRCKLLIRALRIIAQPAHLDGLHHNGCIGLSYDSASDANHQCQARTAVLWAHCNANRRPPSCNRAPDSIAMLPGGIADGSAACSASRSTGDSSGTELCARCGTEARCL